MRLRARHLLSVAGPALRPAAWLAAAVVLAGAGAYLTVSAARALGSARAAHASAGSARSFDGTSAVGALFSVTGGKLGTHFCTASVVHSPNENLLITAAHCVWQRSPGSMVFVPGYHAGVSPHGRWKSGRSSSAAPGQPARTRTTTWRFSWWVRLARRSSGTPGQRPWRSARLPARSPP